jgi:hypothetical protein
MDHYKKPMKKILFIISFLLLTIIADCQNWAPIGAKWTYTQTFASSFAKDTIVIKSIGDTIIQGKNCKILKKSDVVCDDRPFKEYMYSDSGKVFFYDDLKNRFQMLYNFNAQVGDTYTVFPAISPFDSIGNDSIVINVDSISTTIINSITLKKLFVHRSNLGEWPCLGGIIIENIGDLFYMFPWISGLCDINFAGPLRCYEDSIIGFHDFGTAPSCDYVDIGIIENKKINNVSILPNPATDRIVIDCLDSRELNISIYNLIGHLVLLSNIDNKKNEIDISNLATGMYIIKVTGVNWTVQRKIIKE